METSSKKKTADEEIRELREKVCHVCNGSGIVDDAYPGDIIFNTYTCDNCQGTGWSNGS